MANPSSPELWRAALHDLQGLLGSLQASLDLRGPGASLDADACRRLEAAVEDGLGRLNLARVMALGPWPSAEALEAEAWKGRLRRHLAPQERLYRCPVELRMRGPQGPGELGVLWAAAMTRLLMPQAVPGPLVLDIETQDHGWSLAWSPVLGIPQALQAGSDPGRAWDLHTLWAREVAASAGIHCELESGRLLALWPK